MSIVGFSVGVALASAATYQIANLWRDVTSHQRQTNRLWRKVGRDVERSIQTACQSAVNESLDNRKRSAWRTMEVAQIVQESDDCRSFYLVDAARQQLPTFLPGQYITIRPIVSHGSTVASRCYSLSEQPDSRYYRITVKRVAEWRTSHDTMHDVKNKGAGLISHFLHDEIKEGDCLQIKGPTGDFVLSQDSNRPLILIALGIGVTPMVSMAKWVATHVPDRPMQIHYQSRNGRTNPLGDELYRLSIENPNLRLCRYFSRPLQEDVASQDYDVHGYLKLDEIIATAPADAEYYFCGPDDWMQQVRHRLELAGIADRNVHWESFGRVPRKAGKFSAINVEKASDAIRNDSVSVHFLQSDIKVAWSDQYDNLLELAEHNQVTVPSGCRIGSCGSCVVKYRGNVKYNENPSCALNSDEIALCVAKPNDSVEIDA